MGLARLVLLKVFEIRLEGLLNKKLVHTKCALTELSRNSRGTEMLMHNCIHIAHLILICLYYICASFIMLSAINNYVVLTHFNMVHRIWQIFCQNNQRKCKK